MADRDLTEAEQAQRPLALEPAFNELLGRFFASWSSFDMTVDFALGRFLNISDEQVHLIASGMLFGRKARLLRDLIARSDHPKKAALLHAFNKASNSNRDVFAHSHIDTTPTTVTFVERSSSGEYRAKGHTYTLKEFARHVLAFVDAGTDFHNALGVDPAAWQQFGKVAITMDRKANKPSSVK